MGYVPLNDYDTSFLPEAFEKDSILLDNNGEPCYTCKEPSQFYNVTVGRNECEKHTSSRERDML
jgi:hypothetical protein